MKKYLAEGIGTFSLVFMGTGAIIVNQQSNNIISHSGISFVFAFIVLVMVYTFGDISGAHLNPAVSIGFWIARRFSGKFLFPYIASQCTGAILASITLFLLFDPPVTQMGATIPRIGLLSTFLLEVLLTFMLMLVILRVSTGAKEKGIMAGVAVGGFILVAALFAGPVTGASMNPARSLAPALFSLENLKLLWIYLFAPVTGSILAALLHTFLFDARPRPDR